MAFDVFAHAVYGVELAGETADRAVSRAQDWLAGVEACWNQETDALPDGATEGDVDTFDELSAGERLGWALRRVFNTDPGLKAGLFAGCPADAGLFVVDDADQHPGRSGTEPGTLLVGYGLLAFPRAVDPGFAAKANWHTWVTGS
jgi:hypothetical protein